jgi:threonyl-tRNA synthetase
VLIEHFAGAFPIWLAPIQAVVIPIADRHLAYAQQVKEQLRGAGIRIDVDNRGERMNAKIRDAQNQKIPYMLVIGDREVEQGTISVRLRSGENLGGVPIEDFMRRAESEIKERI